MRVLPSDVGGYTFSVAKLLTCVRNMQYLCCCLAPGMMRAVMFRDPVTSRNFMAVKGANVPPRLTIEKNHS